MRRLRLWDTDVIQLFQLTRCSIWNQACSDFKFLVPARPFQDLKLWDSWAEREFRDLLASFCLILKDVKYISTKQHLANAKLKVVKWISWPQNVPELLFCWLILMLFLILFGNEFILGSIYLRTTSCQGSGMSCPLCFFIEIDLHLFWTFLGVTPMPPQVDLEGSGRIELLIVIQLIDHWKQEVVMKRQISALLILCANIY